jgi:hypothetical protein
VYIVGGGAEACTGAHSSCQLEAAIPLTSLATYNLRLVLRLLFILEWELKVELQSVPDALPHADPLVGSSVVTRDSAAPIYPGSRASGWRTSHGCSLHQAVFHARLAVPRAARRHSVQTGTEDVRELLAAMAVHQLRSIAELIAHHACVITAIIFKCVVVLLDDHGRIDVGDLLLVLDGILRKLGACIMVSMLL